MTLLRGLLLGVAALVLAAAVLLAALLAAAVLLCLAALLTVVFAAFLVGRGCALMSGECQSVSLVGLGVALAASVSAS